MTEQTETESALAAMSRAAITARERALRFGSHLVSWRDGSVVLLDPRTYDAEQDGAGQPATRPESKSEGNDKSQLEAEGRSR
jgi:hypothetical protein